MYQIEKTLLFALSSLLVIMLIPEATAINPIWTDTEDSTIYSSDISDDGEITVIGQLDYDVNIYANSTLEKERELEDTPVYKTDNLGLTMVAISGNGRTIGLAGEELQVYSNNSENPLWVFDSGDDITTISISYDGESLVTGNEAGKIQLFDSSENEPVWTYNSGGEISSISISDNGEYIIAGRTSGNLYFFHRETNSPIWTYNDGGSISSVSISNEGESIVVTNTNKKLYAFEKDNNIPEWTYEAEEQLDSVAISGNGQFIISGGGDTKLRLHDFSNSTPLWTYVTDGWILDVDISKNGQYVVAGGIGSKFYCLNVITGNVIWTYTASNVIQTVSISENGKYVIGGGYGKEVYYFISPLNPLSYIDVAPKGIEIKGESLYFEGSAEDEGNISSYIWNSSLDGNISNQKSFTTNLLSSGEHIVEFRALYNNGNYSEPSFAQFIINSKPEITNTNIYPKNSNYEDEVTFESEVNDTDGYIEYFEWISIKDGLLSDEQSFTTNLLSEGTHLISLRAIDNLGTWSEYTNETIHVYKTKIPNATITSISNSPIQYGENVTLSGEGEDEDGTVVGFQWYSSIDGYIGNSSFLKINNLSPGTHTISFSVMDNSSAWSNTEESIIVINSKPTINSIISSKDEFYRPGSLEINIFGTDNDGIDNEAQIIIEIKHKENLSWEILVQTTIAYNDDYIWADTLTFTNEDFAGTYLLRARLIDGYGTYGDWYYLNSNITLKNTLPVVTELSVMSTSTLRGKNITLVLDGNDDNTTLDEMQPLIEVKHEEGNWSNSEINNLFYFNGKYVFNFTTTSQSELGKYQIRCKLLDGDNEYGNWTYSSNITVINNSPAVLELSFNTRNVGRGQEITGILHIQDIEDNSSSIIAIITYKSPQDILWQTEHIKDIQAKPNDKIHFTFAPGPNAFFGSYSFQIKLIDSDGNESNILQKDSTIDVINSLPIIKTVIVPEKNKTFEDDDFLIFEVVGEDYDGEILAYRWTSNLDGIISNNAKFSLRASELENGKHFITLQLKDDLGDWSDQETFELTIANKDTLEESNFLGRYENVIYLLGDLTATLLVLFAIGYFYTKRQEISKINPLDKELDIENVNEIIEDERIILEWEKPDELPSAFFEKIDEKWFNVIIEMIKLKRKSYLNYPENEKEIDLLYNNRERFTISSYFEVPVNPAQILYQWALPENLKGNIHLDKQRKEIIDKVVESHLNKNYVIIGEPGIGKTVLLFDIIDRLTDKFPCGILTTNSLGNIHQIIGMRLFYDDIPENLSLLTEIVERKLLGIVVTSREADWEALPNQIQEQFERITVPNFSNVEMKTLCLKMLDSWSITYSENAIEQLIENSEGSPIYIWSLIKEMLHKDKRHLDTNYLKKNSAKGLMNYVSMFLQRLLKTEGEYRQGGLHQLALLSFLGNNLFEKECHDVYFDKFAKALSKHTSEILNDEFDEKIFSKTLVYLSGEGNLIRFPHDTWVDVIQGQGKFNPFKTELRKIQSELADNGIFKEVQLEIIPDVWKSVHDRYNNDPIANRDSIITLIETFFNNFSIDEIVNIGIDLADIKNISNQYSHLPSAAKIISRINELELVEKESSKSMLNTMMNTHEMGASAISHTPYIVEELYLIYNDGRMIKSILSDEERIDSDIMSSMLTAINDFVKDSFETTNNLGVLKYGESQIIMERGEKCILAAVVYGETTRELSSRMINALIDIETAHKEEIGDWNGDVDSITEAEPIMNNIMSTNKLVTKLMIDSYLGSKDIKVDFKFEEKEGFLCLELVLNNYSEESLNDIEYSFDYREGSMKIAAVSPKYNYDGRNINIPKLRRHSENPIEIYFEILDKKNLFLNCKLNYRNKFKKENFIDMEITSGLNWDNKANSNVKNLKLKEIPKIKENVLDMNEKDNETKNDDKFEELKQILNELGEEKETDGS